MNPAPQPWQDQDVLITFMALFSFLGVLIRGRDAPGFPFQGHPALVMPS